MRLLIFLLVFVGVTFGEVHAQSEILFNAAIGSKNMSAVITFDDKHIIGMDDYRLLRYDFATGTYIGEVWKEPNASTITALAILSDDEILVASKNALRLISLKDGKEQFLFTKAPVHTSKVKVNYEGDLIAALSNDGYELSILDSYTGEVRFNVTSNNAKREKITAFDFSQDGKSILIAVGKTVQDWNIKRSKMREQWDIEDVRDIQSIPGTKYFVTSVGSSTIVINSNRQANIASAKLSSRLRFMAIIENKNLILAGDEDYFYTFDLEARLLQKQPHTLGSGYSKMDLTPYGWMLLKDAQGAFVFLDMFAVKTEKSKQYDWRKNLLKEMTFEQSGSLLRIQTADYDLNLTISSTSVDSESQLSEPKYTFLQDRSRIQIVRNTDDQIVRTFVVEDGGIQAWETSKDVSKLFLLDSKNQILTYDIESRRLLGEIQRLGKKGFEIDYLGSHELLAIRNADGVSFVTSDRRELSIPIDYTLNKVEFSLNESTGVISGSKNGIHHFTVLTFSGVAKAFRAVHTIHLESDIDGFALSPDGSFIIISESRGLLHVFDVSQKQFVAKIQIMNGASEYLVWNQKGEFDESKLGSSKYLYEILNGQAVAPRGLNKVDGLLYRIFSEMELYETKSIEAPDFETIDFRPVYFVSPSRGETVSTERVKFTIQQNPRFEDIEVVNVFHNEIIASQVPLLRFAKDENDRNLYTFDLGLAPGMNTIEVKTILTSKREQRDDIIHIVRDQVSRESGTLHVLGVGVDNYNKDAKRIAGAVEEMQLLGATLTAAKNKVFQDVQLKSLSNGEASNASIVSSLKEINGKLGKQDVVVVFLAGAGGNDLDEGLYFMPADENEKLSLKEMSSIISSDNLLIVMDIEAYNFRELNDLSSIMLLDRTMFLLVNNRTQNGIFASKLLLGLNGDADTGIRDGIVTARELRSYLRKQLDDAGTLLLSRGNDFPLSNK